MRLLASTPGEDAANRFGDYLTAIGIGHHLEQGDSGAWMIWIEHDDDLDRAKAEWNQFHLNPTHERYTSAGGIARKQRAQQQRDAEKRRKNYVDVRTSWAKQSWTIPPVTLTLIALCLIAALLTMLGQRPEPAMKYLVFATSYTTMDDSQDAADDSPSAMLKERLAPLTRGDISRGQVWRLLTPIFLHFGALHLIFNLWMLRDFGAAIERRKGWLLLLALVVISGILGNIGQSIMAGPFFGGMSGVVYALFGYIWMKGVFEPWDGLGAPSQTVSIMLLWLVLCIVGIIPGIANTAHVVGLIVGMLFGSTKGAWQKMRRKMRFN
jgi:GlpG protein